MFCGKDKSILKMQGFFRARLYTLHAKDALRCVFSLAGTVRDIDIHRACPFACAAGGAFFRVVFYAQKGKVAGRL